MRVASTRTGSFTKGIKVQEMRIRHPARGPAKPDACGRKGFDCEKAVLKLISAYAPSVHNDRSEICEKPEEHVGARYAFRIMEVKERGKNIVVSRRVLLEEEREKKSKEIMAMLKPDLVCEGQVTKVTDFGAFVDLGGVEGMVHVSEISRSRISHPSEVLKPGQPVR
jgi:ribosomal protein S1